MRATHEALGRSFIWTCDRPFEGADFSYEFTGMELELKSLIEPSKPEAIFEFISSKDLSLWKKVVGPTFDFEEGDIDSFVKLYEGKEKFFHVIAKIHDTVVGAGTLQIHEGVAILHNITTFPEARGKGIGSRIDFELLTFAKEQGCSRSLIQGASKAESLYQRLGYKTQKVFYANFFKYPFLNTHKNS